MAEKNNKMRTNILVIIFNIFLFNDAKSICGCSNDSLLMKLNTGDSISVTIEKSYNHYGEAINRYSSIDVFSDSKSLAGRVKFTNGNLSSFSKIVKCKEQNIEIVKTLNNDTIIRSLISKKNDKEGFVEILNLQCKKDALVDTVFKFPMKKTRTFETENGHTTEIIFYGIVRGKEIVTKRVVSKYDQNNLLYYEKNEFSENIIKVLNGIGKMNSDEFIVKTALINTDTTNIKKSMYYLDDMLFKTVNQTTKFDSLGRKKNVEVLTINENNEIDELQSYIEEYSFDQNIKNKLIITRRSINQKIERKNTIFSHKIEINGLTTDQIVDYLKKFNLTI